MANKIIAAVAVAMCLMTSLADAQGQARTQVTAEVTAQVLALFSDPSSVQLDSLTIYHTWLGDVICGYINTKSEYSVSFERRPFIVEMNKGQVYPPFLDDPENNHSAKVTILHCNQARIEAGRYEQEKRVINERLREIKSHDSRK